MPNLIFANYDGSGNQVLDPNSAGNSSSGSSSGGVTTTTIGSGAKFISHASSFTTGAGTAVGKIFDGQYPALADFIGVKLVYQNWDTTAPMTINAAKVGSCATDKGTVASWSDFVTFNGSQGATVPIAVAGIGGAAMPNIIPGTLISDFIAVDSIARTDVPANAKLLRVRTHINDNTFPTWASFSTQITAAPTLQFALGASNGAVSTLTSAAVTLVTSTQFHEPVGIIFVYKSANVKTLAVFGDSLSMGAGTVSGIGWPGRITTEYYNKGGTIISAMNFAESGQTLEDSHSILRNYCAIHKPTYCAFYAFSPNSTGRTAANFLTRWTMVLQTIDFLESKGIKPVVMTSTGVETYSQAENDQVALQNTRVKGLAGRCIVIDGASKVYDFSANLYNPLMKFDVTHYNDLGHLAIAAVAYPALA